MSNVWRQAPWDDVEDEDLIGLVEGRTSQQVADDYFEAQAGGGFVDLAAAINGASIVTAGLAVDRGIGAVAAGAQLDAAALAIARDFVAALVGIGGTESALDVLRGMGATAAGSAVDAAALGLLRNLAAAGAGSGVTLAGLERLSALAAGSEGTTAAVSAIGILRNLADEIGSGGEATAEVDVLRSLAAAALAAMGVSGALATGGAEAGSPAVVPSHAPAARIISGRRYIDWLLRQPIQGVDREEDRILAWTLKEAERIEIDDLEILELA